MSRSWVEVFLSHSAEKFRRGTLLICVSETLRCIRKFRVAENFMHQRGGYQVSSSKTFCRTVPRNFIREHFGVSENFVHRKILCIRRVYYWTPLKNLCLTDKIPGFERILVSKSFKQRRGKLHGFVESFFLSHRTQKSFAREPFCVSENFW